MEAIHAVSPDFEGDTKIFRQVTFDRPTFDALQDTKRALSAHWGDLLTNAEVLRVLVLSHPMVAPSLYPRTGE